VESFDDIDDVGYDADQDGRQVRRELARKVLARGSWPTAMYLYQELDPRTEQWRPAKVAIVRFQSRNGQLRKHASITLGEAQATTVAALLSTWFSAEARAERGDAPASGDAGAGDGDE
jgi:hypothetical protein